MGLFTTVSILSSDFSTIGATLREAAESGASMIHWDVMDGHFVPNLTFGSKLIDDYRRYSDLPFDTHLMISAPGDYLDFFLKSSDWLTFHLEAADSPGILISRIRTAGKKAGLSIKPQTPLSLLDPYLKDLDSVLMMGVEPGFGGQTIDPGIYDRLKTLSRMRRDAGASFRIVVDGGVHSENALPLYRAGADGVVLGSSFVKAADKRKLIEAVSSVQ